MGVESSRLILFLVGVLTVFSLVSLGFFFYSAQNLFNAISGYSTSTASANLTVESSAIINFTTNQINWGSGRVNAGSSFATLTTEGTNNVTNGNWTLQTSGGLRLQNDGNTNVSLNFSVGKTAAQMIGGTGPDYSWKFSSPEAGSCLNSTGGSSNLPNFNQDYTATATSSLNVCGRFRYTDSSDLLRIDFSLYVPSDSLTGALGDVITATAVAVQ